MTTDTVTKLLSVKLGRHSMVRVWHIISEAVPNKTLKAWKRITPHSAADNFGRFTRDNGSAATAHKVHKVGSAAALVRCDLYPVA